MRTIVALCLVVALTACKKEDDKAPPAPKPQPAAKAAPDAAPAPAADCVVKVEVTTDKVRWDGGGLAGDVARTAGTAPDLAALAPLAGKCGANLTAQGDVSYQDLIGVMDVLVKHGITAIGLGEAPAKAPPPPPAGKADLQFQVTADGTLVGHFDTPPDLSKVPIVVITTKAVSVNGKQVAELAAGDFSAALAAALPATPADPTIVIQADKALPYDPVRVAVETVGKAGYTNVLFAVKNK